MHELSVAQALIDAACEAAGAVGATKITRLNIRVGRLAGVVKDALLFSFQLAAEGTACAGGELLIDDVPITVACPQCDESKTLSDSYHFVCPTCGTATPQILTGRELELVSIEIEEAEDEPATGSPTAESLDHLERIP